jgi:hypothetical protein
VLRSQHRVYDGRGEVARTQDVWGAEGISGRVKFLLLAWAGMPKTSFRKNSDSPHTLGYNINFLTFPNETLTNRNKKGQTRSLPFWDTVKYHPWRSSAPQPVPHF